MDKIDGAHSGNLSDIMLISDVMCISKNILVQTYKIETTS